MSRYTQHHSTGHLPSLRTNSHTGALAQSRGGPSSSSGRPSSASSWRKADQDEKSKQDVDKFFKKLHVSQNSASKGGGASSLCTQDQQLLNADRIRKETCGKGWAAGGRNFSPVDPSDYAPLLDPCPHDKLGKQLLVLDIDETLVHSSFQPVKADIVLPVEIDGVTHTVYVKKRPFVDEFIRKISPWFEIAVFTASLSKYADPLMDTLDPGKKYLGTHRLFREHCSQTNGAYVKDLSLLGRPLHRICIIDNSPVAALFQPSNAIRCVSYFDDTNPPNDRELLDFIPLLERMCHCETVYEVLDDFNAKRSATEGHNAALKPLR